MQHLRAVAFAGICFATRIQFGGERPARFHQREQKAPADEKNKKQIPVRLHSVRLVEYSKKRGVEVTKCSLCSTSIFVAVADCLVLLFKVIGTFWLAAAATAAQVGCYLRMIEAQSNCDGQSMG